MVNWKSRKLGDVLAFLNVIVFVVLINLLVSNKFYRIDLTEEQRYTIKDQTRNILKGLEDDVYVEIFLTGDLNAEFERFQKRRDRILVSCQALDLDLALLPKLHFGNVE